MKERPILFTGPMVRAIIDGRKTQTRRPVKFEWCGTAEELLRQSSFDPAYKSPFGTIGDRLWVRETWGLMSYHDTTDWCGYSIKEVPEAELRERFLVEHAANWDLPNESAYWRPSIHMPRWASCIDLEITAVRVERLQDITEDDAIKEGIEQVTFLGDRFWKLTTPIRRLEGGETIGTLKAREAFQNLWQSIHGNRPKLPDNSESKRYQRVNRWLDKHPPTGWDANPWVWVYEFRRIKP